MPQCGIQKPRFPCPPQPVLHHVFPNPCFPQPCANMQIQGGTPPQSSQGSQASESPPSMTGVAPPSNTSPTIARQKSDIPQHWSQDPDFLDASRTIGNLTLPRYVQPTVWAKSEGIAGLPVAELQLHQFLCQGWNSYWLRHFARGREGYVCVTKNKGELVLVNELLSLPRNKGIYIESAAVNLASQKQGNLAKNVAMKSPALHLADTVSALVPVSTDPASQDTIRDLQQRVADLAQQLQARVDRGRSSRDPGARIWVKPGAGWSSSQGGRQTSTTSRASLPSSEGPGASTCQSFLCEFFVG